MGQPLDPDAFTHAAKRLARAAGLDRARLHDSRHGAATQLLAAGVHPEITSAVLGHTDPGFHDADLSARPRRDGRPGG